MTRQGHATHVNQCPATPQLADCMHADPRASAKYARHVRACSHVWLLFLSFFSYDMATTEAVDWRRREPLLRRWPFTICRWKPLVMYSSRQTATLFSLCQIHAVYPWWSPPFASRGGTPLSHAHLSGNSMKYQTRLTMDTDFCLALEIPRCMPSYAPVHAFPTCADCSQPVRYVGLCFR